MDRKSIIILVATGILFLTWPMLVNKIYPPIPAAKNTNAPAIATNGNFPGATISSADTNRFAANTLTSTNAPAGKEENITVENQWARYHFSSIGGGITLIELKDFKSFVGCKADKAATNPPASLNRKSPVPMFDIRNADGFLGDDVFRLSTNGPTVRAEKTLTNGLVLVKDFQLLTNFQFKVTTRWENHGTAPARLPSRQFVIGTATPMGAFDELRTIRLDWYDGKNAIRTDRNWFNPSSFLFVFSRPGKEEYKGGAGNVQWAATHNQFFTAVVTPSTNAPAVIGRPI
ncbi:MAG TPA: hypothetical protein VI282_10500, partial [Verrucomicrobiae bacterium]